MHCLKFSLLCFVCHLLRVCVCICLFYGLLFCFLYFFLVCFNQQKLNKDVKVRLQNDYEKRILCYFGMVNSNEINYSQVILSVS